MILSIWQLKNKKKERTSEHDGTGAALVNEPVIILVKNEWKDVLTDHGSEEWRVYRTEVRHVGVIGGLRVVWTTSCKKYCDEFSRNQVCLIRSADIQL